MTIGRRLGVASSVIGVALCLLLSACSNKSARSDWTQLVLNDSSYFEAPGLNVMVFSHSYDGLFDDSKMAGIEIVHHGLCMARNGDVRLNPAPGQWDLHSKLIEKKVERKNNLIIAQLKYDNPHFIYQIQARLGDGGIYVSVWTDQPIPDELKGIASLDIEFAPMLYVGHTYIMDGKVREIPYSPHGEMIIRKTDTSKPLPIATGKKFDINPDDAERHITVSSAEQNLLFYDGWSKAQNGWLVLRSLLPAGKSGKILEWFISGETKKS